MIAVNLNSPSEVRNAGIQALENALGRVGMVKFMQQFEQGHGDYTAEKYDMPETTMEEVEAFLANEK